MQIYLVGGAVRDQLLNRPIKDKDWVVVGGDVESMIQQGFQPIGRDFPVFLHPESHEEYALARTERKIKAGYAGFEFYTHPDITLEQDLARRDLTINAMAQDKYGNIIDPFGGQKDLNEGILRHVGPAFSEDPVRILRTARFAARYQFRVADNTMALMKDMVENGEIHALVAERVWQEFAKGLMEPHAEIMIQVLQDCGALSVLLPEVSALFGIPQSEKYHPEIDCGVHTLLVLKQAIKMNLSLAERYAALLHDVGKSTTPPTQLPHHINHDIAGVPLIQAVNQRWKTPKSCGKLAELVCRWHIIIHRFEELRPQTILCVLRSCDAFRQPQRFYSLLNVCEADVRGRLHHESENYPQKNKWQTILQELNTLNIQEIIAGIAPEKIAETIDKARINQIKHSLKALKNQ